MSDKINKIRVGAVPYYIEDEQIYMYFMVPSDPKFGGTNPQIAKGVYEGENSLQAEALREAEEELGLKNNNIRKIFHVYTSNQTTKRGINQFHVWAVNIIDPDDFKTPHWETGSTHWLTPQEIKAKFRKDQQIPIWNLLRKVKAEENL